MYTNVDICIYNLIIKRCKYLNGKSSWTIIKKTKWNFDIFISELELIVLLIDK